MSLTDKSDNIRILVVGLGGIGSQLTELIVPALDISGLNVELNLMDGDVVEDNNLAHQRFSKDPDHYFRMSIDRAFSLNGIGLVVTGMIFSGSVCISDKLTLSSNGMPVRIREIRSNNQVTSRAKVGERCALNISGRGISERSIERGTWLTHPNLNVLTRRIDVDLKVLETEPNSLKHWTPAHLHIGSDHLSARVAVLSR